MVLVRLRELRGSSAVLLLAVSGGLRSAASSRFSAEHRLRGRGNEQPSRSFQRIRPVEGAEGLDRLRRAKPHHAAASRSARASDGGNRDRASSAATKSHAPTTRLKHPPQDEYSPHRSSSAPLYGCNSGLTDPPSPVHVIRESLLRNREQPRLRELRRSRVPRPRRGDTAPSSIPERVPPSPARTSPARPPRTSRSTPCGGARATVGTTSTRRPRSAPFARTRQLRRVERRTERRVAEHDRLGGTVLERRTAPRAPPTATSPSGTVLRPARLFGVRDLIPDERLPHVEAPLEELDVLPPEPEQLAPP